MEIRRPQASKQDRRQVTAVYHDCNTNKYEEGFSQMPCSELTTFLAVEYSKVEL